MRSYRKVRTERTPTRQHHSSDKMLKLLTIALLFFAGCSAELLGNKNSLNGSATSNDSRSGRFIWVKVILMIQQHWDKHWLNFYRIFMLNFLDFRVCSKVSRITLKKLTMTMKVLQVRTLSFRVPLAFKTFSILVTCNNCSINVNSPDESSTTPSSSTKQASTTEKIINVKDGDGEWMFLH